MLENSISSTVIRTIKSSLAKDDIAIFDCIMDFHFRAKPTACGVATVTNIYRIHMCDEDPTEAAYRAIALKAPWFIARFGVDLADCKGIQTLNQLCTSLCYI